MMTLTFKVNANPPAPSGPEVTRATMGEFPENEVDFDDHTPIVLTGSGLAYNAGAGDTLKIELRPDKGEATAVLDELKSITPSADGTTLSMINEVNTSGKPDGSWWGRDALITVTIGGVAATHWVKFHDWNSAKGTTQERDGSKFSGRQAACRGV